MKEDTLSFQFSFQSRLFLVSKESWLSANKLWSYDCGVSVVLRFINKAEVLSRFLKDENS